ncbi:MAG: hypothetical protein ABSA33_04730 [Candidatus Micrarchaeaceae archaeon]
MGLSVLAGMVLEFLIPALDRSSAAAAPPIKITAKKTVWVNPNPILLQPNFRRFKFPTNVSPFKVLRLVLTLCNIV